MSGVCGVLNHNHHSQITEKDFTQMVDALALRGQDYSDKYYDELTMLGFTGLEFLSTHQGHQPVSIENGAFTIVFDGEVYDIKSIKNFVSEKYGFNSLTDMEALLYHYKSERHNVCDELNGSFALAIWDRESKLLFCARDRAGQKPFFYYNNQNYFAFASELKALMKLPINKKSIDYCSLMKYFAINYIPYPNTIYSDIRQLAPGESLIVENGSLQTQRYWDIPYSKYYDKEDRDKKLDVTCRNLIAEIRKSITLRLDDEIPIGAFVSGGIDSSAIVSQMSDLSKPQAINTFSVKFKEHSFDESEQVKEITELYSTIHHMVVVEPQDFIDNLSEIMLRVDEPIGDASILPRYMLSKYAKEYVSVVLTGDGGDEIFAGYPAFYGQIFSGFFNKIPKSVTNAVFFLVNRLPVSSKNYSFDYLLKQFFLGLGYETEIMAQIWHGNFQVDELKHLFNEDLYQYITDEIIFYEISELSNLSRMTFKNDFVTRLLYFYFRYLLSGDLPKADRMNMTSSIETRCPFLDKDLVEYVVAIKPELKFRNLKLKYILRKALEGWVPQSILDKRKMGYTVPIGNWFKNELRPMMLDVLSLGNLKKYGLFNEKYVESLIKDHLNNKKDNWKKLWSLFFFSLWYDEYILKN